MFSPKVQAQLAELHATLKDSETFMEARDELIEEMATGEQPYVMYNGNPYPLAKGICELTGIEPMQVLDNVEFRALTIIMAGVAVFKVREMIAHINEGEEDDDQP